MNFPENKMNVSYKADTVPLGHWEPYTSFYKQIKKQVKKQNPKKKDYEICKIVGELWIELDPKEKIKYYTERCKAPSPSGERYEAPSPSGERCEALNGSKVKKNPIYRC